MLHNAVKACLVKEDICRSIPIAVVLCDKEYVWYIKIRVQKCISSALYSKNSCFVKRVILEFVFEQACELSEGVWFEEGESTHQVVNEFFCPMVDEIGEFRLLFVNSISNDC